MTKCVNCGNEKLRHGSVPTALNVAGHVFSAQVPADECAVCGEVYYAAEDLRRFELVVARALALAGASSGEVFKLQRKALGLKAAELGALLDASAETISRWETGQRAIPRAALAVVATLVEDALGKRTDTAAKLRALGKPKRIAKRVRLDFASGEARAGA